MQDKKKPGRKPSNPAEGAAKNYTIRLTDAQSARALKFGDSVSQGVNAALRTLAGHLPVEVTREIDEL